MANLNPVYVTLVSNNGAFSKLIKKFTSTDYSHATISMDASMNNMYSFSDIPFNKGMIASGFVRESIYSPTFKHVKYFSIYVIFFSDEEYKLLKEKISWFIENFYKYKYSYSGLISYLLKKSDSNGMSEKERRKFFCSNFVAWIINSCKSGTFYDIMLNPQELSYNNKLHFVQTSTIEEYNPKKTIEITKKLMKEEIQDINGNYELADEIWVPKIVKGALNRLDEKEITQYTSFINWEKLMHDFKKYFKSSSIDKRFGVIELIIRKTIMNNLVPKNEITNKISSELKKMSESCPNLPIIYTNVDDAYIVFDNGNRTICVDYPSFNMRSI